MKFGFRMVGQRMVKVTTHEGKRYIPVLGNRWLHLSFRRRTDAEKYRDRVRRRFERMSAANLASIYRSDSELTVFTALNGQKWGGGSGE